MPSSGQPLAESGKLYVMGGSPELIKATAGAQRAMGLAELVNKVFSSERVKSTVAGHPGYRLEMSGPAGPSTSGPSVPRDHLALIALGDKSAEAPVPVGVADAGLSQVELRSFDQIMAHHQRHAGEELRVDRDDYTRLLKKVENFFDRQGITVSVAATIVESASPRGSSRTKVIAIALAACVVVVIAVVFALRGAH